MGIKVQLREEGVKVGDIIRVGYSNGANGWFRVVVNNSEEFSIERVRWYEWPVIWIKKMFYRS